MAPKYKLYYFEYTGAAEPIRYIFAYVDQEYQDIRIKREKWPEFKKTTPFGKMPFIEIDGEATPQSGAIVRYLGRKFNLIGDSEEHAFQCDWLFETLKDLQQVLYTWYQEENTEKKNDLKKKLLEEVFPFYFKKFDNIVAKNGGFFVGKKITYIDLTIAAVLPIYEEVFPDILKPFSALNDLVEKINNLPNIKKWLKQRPPSIAV